MEWWGYLELMQLVPPHGVLPQRDGTLFNINEKSFCTLASLLSCRFLSKW
uniref:Uncharacterized protein n=1 Tax=Rhizophora mucronata TaxID=61149 RepID=A0A2P2IX67_RHIMU